MIFAYLLGAFALVGGIGLTISSAWLITMASFAPPILTLSVAIVMVRFFGIFRSVARYGERLISHKAVFENLTSLRVKIYSAITETKLASLLYINSGSNVKTLVDDVERAQEYQLRIKLPGVSAALAITTGVLLGWWIRPESLLISIPATALLLVLFPRLISRFALPMAKVMEQKESHYTESVEGSVHGVIEARLYGYLDASFQSSAQLEDELVQLESKMVNRVGMASIATNILISLTLIGNTVLALHLSQSQAIPAVKIAMLIFLPLVMYEAVTGWYPNLFISGKVLASQKSVQVLLREKEVKQVKSQLGSSVEQISCSKVKVSWNENFMTEVSFQLNRGELLVIRGISGSGKSTLLMGMLGLLAYEGSIKINQTELSEIVDVNQFVVGTVQHAHIFNTSIRENLKIGNHAASDREILTMLEELGLDELLGELPQGLDTVIGAFGRQLSGGEAKRLAVARTLLAKSDIYIFDEPTEHLDSQTAFKVQAAIRRHCRGSITIVATHMGWMDSNKTLTMSR